MVTITLDPLSEDYPEFKDFNKAYINPHIIEVGGEEVSMEEGCLSLPGIHESVKRGDKIRVKYMDENFVEHDEVVEGYLARVMQHEFDHLERKDVYRPPFAVAQTNDKRKIKYDAERKSA